MSLEDYLKKIEEMCEKVTYPLSYSECLRLVKMLKRALKTLEDYSIAIIVLKTITGKIENVPVGKMASKALAEIEEMVK